MVSDLYQDIRGVSGPFDAVPPDGALLVEDRTPGRYLVRFHGLAVLKGQSEQEDLVEPRAEVMVVQTSQPDPAAAVLVRLGLPEVMRRTLLCQCGEEKVAPLYHTLCAPRLCHQFEKIVFPDLPTKLHVD